MVAKYKIRHVKNQQKNNKMPTWCRVQHACQRKNLKKYRNLRIRNIIRAKAVRCYAKLKWK